MIWIIAAAFVADLLIGDPQGVWHPVRFMGWIIEKLHPLVERGGSTERKIRGAMYPAALCLLAMAISNAVYILPYPARELAALYLLYSSLAVRSLAEEVLKVLRIKDISERRRALAMLCSRDTAELDERGINSTLFETTAENSVDGALAPLFYMIAAALISDFCLGSDAGGSGIGFVAVLSAALVYKAVSTCDSMVGYKNERFIDTGMVSARFDDVLNFLPARLSQPFVLVAGAVVVVCRRGPAAALRSSVRGVKIYFRDRRKHESPNSCHAMSMFAGILGVRICGPVSYFGKVKPKEFVGEDVRRLTDAAVIEAVAVMILSAVLMMIAGAALSRIL